MLGIIRVLTTKDESILNEHGKLMDQFLGVKTVTNCIQDQPNGIYDDYSENVAIPKITNLAEEMIFSYDLEAISISCAADPALDETRKLLNIPVLGAGICGAHAAGMVGNKVGIIGITEEAPERMVAELGNLYYSHVYSPYIRKTTDLFTDGAKDELLRLGQQLVTQGANVILFGCTGFSTIHLKDYLKQYINVPIIDLVESQAIAYKLIDRGG